MREKAAVHVWLESDLPFHIMRDHPLHRSPIMAGMWGVKSGLFKDIKGMITTYLTLVNHDDIRYSIDQEFVSDIIYPLVQDRSLIHSDIFSGTLFPMERHKYEFVGQVFEADDSTPAEHTDLLKRYIFLHTQSKAEAAGGYSQQTIEIALANIKFGYEG